MMPTNSEARTAGPQFMTLEDVASELRRSSRTVARLCERGEIRSVKIAGRRLVPLAAFNELARGGRSAG